MNGYINKMQQEDIKLINFERGQTPRDEIPQSKGFSQENDESTIHQAALRPTNQSQNDPIKATATIQIFNQQFNQSINNQSINNQSNQQSPIKQTKRLNKYTPSHCLFSHR